MAAVSRKVLGSYSGLDAVETDTTHPDSTAALLTAFKQAGESGHTLALRGAGGSLHDQSLSQGAVMMLGQLPRFVDLEDGVLTAASGVSYGEACRTALEHGAIVPIVPTSSRITLGGGFVSNCISRFCSVAGKPADWVDSFELLTPDGRRRIVRQPGPGTSAENNALFKAVPGGFGYLGFVGSVRMRLWQLPPELAGGTPRVETVTTPTTRFEELVDPIVREGLLGSAGGPAAAPGTAIWGLTSQDGRGGVFRSRYVRGDRPLKRFFLHQPRGVLHAVGQFASIFRVWSRLGWSVAWQHMVRGSLRYVDDFDGFTFMMNGNWRARELLGRARIPAWLLQQSYLIPVDRKASDPGAAAKVFLERIRKELHDARIRIDAIDLLAVKADDYWLSASRGIDGLLISPSCQGLSRAGADKVAKVFARLSRECAQQGGRVNLVKNVFVEPDVMQQMYGAQLGEFLALKRVVDPQGVLRNGFLDRLLRE